ncbi:vivid PAS protein VVD [Xylariaceae sp. FL0594]|nr:vivid PAS protein VVD [Xylariaceae sp. FL0594]
MSGHSYYPVPPTMNPWENSALEYNFQGTEPIPAPGDDVHDPIVYPGLYAPSGFNLLEVITALHARPSKMFQAMGPIDDSCPLLVCDMEQNDYPVVYANEACSKLTGYTQPEMVGQNCRFLQTPPRKSKSSSSKRHAVDNKTVLKKVRHAIKHGSEAYVEMVNFKRTGECFVNCLTMIPVWGDQSAKPKYFVGFMAEKPCS